MKEKRDYVAVKVPQFSFTRLAGADPFLGVEMASTGEIAAFGKNVPEAYWNAYLSTNSFKPPKRGSGVLLGGDITRPELAIVAKGLMELGFHLFTSNQEVQDHIAVIPYVSSKKIVFPIKDKRKLREVFDDANIQMVINLARARGVDTLDQDYVARRNAVDFGLPLINNPKLAVLWVQTLAQKMPEGALEPYSEGQIPLDVKSWREWVPHA